MNNVDIQESKRYQILNNLVSLFREYQKNDFDCLILITSPKGFGKSSLSLQIADKLHKRYLDTPFNLEEQVAFTPEQVQERIKNLPEYSALVWDEAVMGAMGEDWNKAVSRALKKDITLCRTKHLVILMNMPNIAWLDNKYRSTLVNFWIHIINRGMGVWFSPDLRPSVKDCWNLDYLDKIFGRKSIDPMTEPHNALNLFKRHTCFQEWFKFPKVRDNLYQRYLKIRNEITQKESVETGGRTYKSMLQEALKIIREKQGLSYRKMEKLLTDPKTNKPLASHMQIANWCKEIEK